MHGPKTLGLVVAAVVLIGAIMVYIKVAISENFTQKKDKIAFQSLLVKTGDIELYTENFGKPSNPAILLIAGAMAHARFWTNDFCTQLANAGYFVIRYDHRDMGLSSAIDYTKNPYTTDDLAKDALAILDTYKIKQAHIIGHSMGGTIAQLLALDYPSRVLSITLISTAMPVGVQLNNEEKQILEKTWLELMKNKPTKKYSESVVGFLNSFEFLHGNMLMDEALAHAYVYDMYERTKPAHLDWFSKFSAGTELLHNHVKAQQNIADRTHDVKNLKIPVFVIHGQEDYLSLPRAIQVYYAEHVPSAQIIIVDRMGHIVLSDELFTLLKNLILDFISKGK